jgi:hypothetical protein
MQELLVPVDTSVDKAMTKHPDVIVSESLASSHSVYGILIVYTVQDATLINCSKQKRLTYIIQDMSNRGVEQTC